MKKILFASSFLLALLSACSDYNDQFGLNPNLTDVKNMTVTLQSGEYASIAQLKANQELALSKDPENKTALVALNAVGSSKYFTEQASGEDYLPAYLNSKYPNADIGSKFIVTYNQYQAPSAYLASFKNISNYTLTSDDYKTVWGNSINASFLSPLSISKIPSLLKSNITGAAAGDMKVVYYAYSSVEPSSGGSNSGEISYTKLSEVVANTTGAEYTVKGQVVATYARGFLLNDGTASILVYLNAYANYSVGDVVSVSGTTSKYSGLMQFPATSVITLLERSKTFAYPSAQTLDGAALDALSAAPTVKYVSFTGKLSISGTYYNITVDGATRQGSISYPIGGVVSSDLNGQDVTVTGYFIGSSAKYGNVMVTSVVAKGATPTIIPVGVVALATAGDYTVSGTVVETYTRGFLLSDGTGNILVYKSNTGVNKGDVVTVKGATSAYSGLMQYGTTAEVTVNGTGQAITKAPMALDAKAMEAYLTSPYVAYVSYQGTLNISGNYYNVIIDGSTVVQGSLSYPATGLINPDLNGKKVIVQGYAIGVSSGKYLNTMVTSVQEATATKAFATRALTRGVQIQPNAAALYVYDGSAWSAYTNTEAKVAVLNPTVYTSLGTNTIANPDYVLPIYLANLYPFAAEGDKVVVVYNNTAQTSKAAEYTFEKGVWIATPAYVPVTTTFSKDANGIAANMSVYLTESFLGNDGGFTIQNVNLGGLTYVWSNTALYGWKATAYANNTNNPAESWIVSPAINLKKGVAPQMTFDEAHRYLNGEAAIDHFMVLISTDYNSDVTKATWTSLAVPTWSDGATWDFVNVGQIDLSAYIGKTVHVAFKYVSNSVTAPTWEVKNLLIKEKADEAAK